MQVFIIFLARLGYFNIYPSLIQQKITIIGKLGQKIAQMHTASLFGSINIPLKFQMISTKWYYTSCTCMNNSHLVTR